MVTGIVGAARPMPTSLGKYEVRAKVADGGMAAIYLGRVKGASPLEGTVALKVIKDEYALNMDFVRMFVDEATIAQRLNHPNIVKIQDFSADGDRIFLAMEFLLGQSLWNVWQACKERGVRLRYDMLAWICAGVCEGLDYAHDLRDESGTPLEIVHRDINATNIFVQYDGTVKIIDFGLAKAVNRVTRTAAGVIKGKLAYMAPEQIMGGGVDRRSDIFGLGVTLWELSVDRRLFKVKDDIDTLKAVHEAKVPDPTTLVHEYPPELWRILKRALVRDKDARFQHARDFGAALEGFATSEGRAVGKAQVAEAMASLFEHERERQMAWIMEASDPQKSAPKYTLNPPPEKMDFAEMGSKVQPRPGTFADADAKASTSDSPREVAPPRDVSVQDLRSPKIPAAPGVPDFSTKKSPKKNPEERKSDAPPKSKTKRKELDTTAKKISEEVELPPDDAGGTTALATIAGIVLALMLVAAVLAEITKK
ncbi:MAG: serine/threonine protein kinase [Polyangiaceae bacterium]